MRVKYGASAAGIPPGSAVVLPTASGLFYLPFCRGLPSRSVSLPHVLAKVSFLRRKTNITQAPGQDTPRCFGTVCLLLSIVSIDISSYREVKHKMCFLDLASLFSSSRRFSLQTVPNQAFQQTLDGSCYAPPGWDVERRETYILSFYDDGLERGGISPTGYLPSIPSDRETASVTGTGYNCNDVGNIRRILISCQRHWSWGRETRAYV